MTTVLKRKTVQTFDGIDSILGLLCYVGVPASVIAAPVFGRTEGLWAYFLTLYVGGVLLSLTFSLFHVHNRMKFHDRAYPILFKLVRRFYFQTRRNGWKEKIPEWARGPMTIGLMLFLILYRVIPLSIVSCFFLVIFNLA